MGVPLDLFQHVGNQGETLRRANYWEPRWVQIYSVVESTGKNQTTVERWAKRYGYLPFRQAGKDMEVVFSEGNDARIDLCWDSLDEGLLNIKTGRGAAKRFESLDANNTLTKFQKERRDAYIENFKLAAPGIKHEVAHANARLGHKIWWIGFWSSASRVLNLGYFPLLPQEVLPEGEKPWPPSSATGGHTIVTGPQWEF